MILFLDFDGVLHPETGRESDLFCRLPLLWKILRTRPEVEVVFSTSWPEVHSPEAMLGFVTSNGGEDLLRRFIGRNPVVPVEPGADDYRRRELECLAWLAENKRDSSDWLALDDIAYWFSDSCPNLYLVNYMTGLTEADVARILERLA